MKKGGKRLWSPPGGIDQAISIVSEMYGNIAACARKFNVARNTFWRYANDHAKVQAAVHQAREAMKDNVESVLYSEARKGEGWAVCFFLKTQAKDRGYVERQEVTGADGGDLVIKVRWPDADTDTRLANSTSEPT